MKIWNQALESTSSTQQLLPASIANTIYIIPLFDLSFALNPVTTPLEFFHHNILHKKKHTLLRYFFLTCPFTLLIFPVPLFKGFHFY
jgi:hypothetical protein